MEGDVAFHGKATCPFRFSQQQEKRLQSLKFYSCFEITDAGLGPIAEGCSSLQRPDLRSCGFRSPTLDPPSLPTNPH